ncbi:hypothetical protein B5V89_06275 [Heyndrickxia sporothermodurans]|nr:hypothetical protein B5V89_06275 [Heyndrickxia sporothermodurans]PTY89602.1 hypothetical protein B5V90_07605 [Heyndrickxia sporothermodurans]
MVKLVKGKENSKLTKGKIWGILNSLRLPNTNNRFTFSTILLLGRVMTDYYERIMFKHPNNIFQKDTQFLKQ